MSQEILGTLMKIDTKFQFAAKFQNSCWTCCLDVARSEASFLGSELKNFCCKSFYGLWIIEHSLSFSIGILNSWYLIGSGNARWPKWVRTLSSLFLLHIRSIISKLSVYFHLMFPVIIYFMLCIHSETEKFTLSLSRRSEGISLREFWDRWNLRILLRRF